MATRKTLDDRTAGAYNNKNELRHPDFPHSQEALKLIDGIKKAPVKDAVRDIAKVYIQQQLMPRNPLGDALHLALASYNKCDYLLTWNCKHLANPNKFARIRICSISLGLYVPTLCTPNQLLEGGNDD